MSTIKTPYDADVGYIRFGVYKRAGYLHGVADTEARYKPLVEAAELQLLNFQRQSASGNFLGDDDHEAWVAFTDALDALSEAPNA